MAHDVFISYSSTDKQKADAVCATLESMRIRCWIAPRDIRPGLEWAEAIIDAIAESKVMVLIFSAEANTSRQVKREVEQAVSQGVVIVPLRIEDVAPTKTMSFYISSVHWLDALSPPLERHLGYLAETVQLLLARIGHSEQGGRAATPAEPSGALPSSAKGAGSVPSPEPRATRDVPDQPTVSQRDDEMAVDRPPPAGEGTPRAREGVPAEQLPAGVSTEEPSPPPTPAEEVAQVPSEPSRLAHQIDVAEAPADASATEAVPTRDLPFSRGPAERAAPAAAGRPPKPAAAQPAPGAPPMRRLGAGLQQRYLAVAGGGVVIIAVILSLALSGVFDGDADSTPTPAASPTVVAMETATPAPSPTTTPFELPTVASVATNVSPSPVATASPTPIPNLAGLIGRLVSYSYAVSATLTVLDPATNEQGSSLIQGHGAFRNGDLHFTAQSQNGSGDSTTRDSYELYRLAGSLASRRNEGDWRQDAADRAGLELAAMAALLPPREQMREVGPANGLLLYRATLTTATLREVLYRAFQSEAGSGEVLSYDATITSLVDGLQSELVVDVFFGLEDGLIHQLAGKWHFAVRSPGDTGQTMATDVAITVDYRDFDSAAVEVGPIPPDLLSTLTAAPTSASEAGPLACPPDPVTLQLWSSQSTGPNAAVLDDAVDRYEAACPTVTVQHQYFAFTDYQAQLSAASAEGSLPDIFQMYPANLDDMVSRGLLLPLKDRLAQGFPQLFANVLQQIIRNGDIYALPTNVYTVQIAYNKKLFDEMGISIPQTQDELIEISKQFLDQGILPVAMGTKDPWTAVDLFAAELVYTDPSHTRLRDADAGKVAWDDPAFLEAARAVEKLVAAGVFAPEASLMPDIPDARDLFVQQKAAMLFPALGLEARDLEAQISGAFDFALFPLPPLRAGQEAIPTGGVAESFSLPAQGENSAVALDFLRYLLNEDGRKALVLHDFVPPVETILPPEKAADPLYRSMSDAASRMQPSLILNGPVFSAAMDGMQALIDGRMSPEDFVRSLATAAKP